MDNRGKPAFPIDCGHRGISEGLSKREYIATQAMVGLLANYEAQVDMQDDKNYNGTNFKEILAENSVAFADALLAELEK
jgi:hypothetical protein